ncbi:MAG: sulfotransferase family protein [Deltaproteobacteria bacterium]|nr:sulfotransferase family protein [Deltaproteobacteria bacterium]
MALDLIGAGWGRTGTMSLKAALERIGFPCHHMSEVFAHPEHVRVFTAAARGERVDWNDVYGSYRATVDWPGSAFWRELMAAYPSAKVLLSEREPERWYESYLETIHQPLVEGWPGQDAWNEMVRLAIVERDLAGKPSDRESVIDAFRRHNAEVRATVPKERLLVFDVREGWEPLCRFLGVDAPDEPFPHLNDRATWLTRHASS